MPGEWSLAPGADPSRVLMFFHGGGYCAGSIVSHRRMATEAGRAAGMRTLAVGYRLAPEHPYPAAHEDALAAWRFLRREGIAAGAIAVGGDSAGGNLALALVHVCAPRARRGPPASGSPRPGPTSRCRARRSATKDADDPLIHKAYLEELADAYAPAPLDRADPLISPLFADFSGFPPTLIQVGSAETLLADATRLAAAMGAADVAVTLEVWPRMIHAWPLWNARLAEGGGRSRGQGRSCGADDQPPRPPRGQPVEAPQPD